MTAGSIIDPKIELFRLAKHKPKPSPHKHNESSQPGMPRIWPYLAGRDKSDRAAIPPKPQSGSRERTIKGKTSRFFSGLLGSVSDWELALTKEEADNETNKKMKKNALLYNRCLPIRITSMYVQISSQKPAPEPFLERRSHYGTDGSWHANSKGFIIKQIRVGTGIVLLSAFAAITKT
jgi:hypothetical protein